LTITVRGALAASCLAGAEFAALQKFRSSAKIWMLPAPADRAQASAAHYISLKWLQSGFKPLWLSEQSMTEIALTSGDA